MISKYIQTPRSACLLDNINRLFIVGLGRDILMFRERVQHLLHDRLADSAVKVVEHIGFEKMQVKVIINRLRKYVT